MRPYLSSSADEKQGVQVSNPNHLHRLPKPLGIREADDSNAQNSSKKNSYENKKLMWDNFQVGFVSRRIWLIMTI